MKKLSLLIIVFLGWLPSKAQETAQEIMEKRAREMHRVIGLDDKDQWKAFMKGNFTQALIDKPMRAVVESSDGSSSSSAGSQTKTSDKLEAKSAMFQQLHDDFGKSKIILTKPTGEKLEMVVANADGLSGTFIFKFTTGQPYLIDGLGIEVEDSEK